METVFIIEGVEIKEIEKFIAQCGSLEYFDTEEEAMLTLELYLINRKSMLESNIIQINKSIQEYELKYNKQL